MRRIDWDRSYGSIHPWMGRAAYVQDEILYDKDGYCVDDGPPPDPATIETNRTAPQQGAVSASGAIPTETVLVPRPQMDWQTMKFFKLRGAIQRERGVKVANFVAAMTYLEQNNLVLKG